jgi:microcystin-dependent protein
MADMYVGEIRQFAGNFAPQGWALCNGAILPIAEYETLFTLIGTTYGGNGESTFALPDLRGRLPVHQGSSGGASYVMGQAAGTEQVTLISLQMPVHSHTPAAAGTGGMDNPGGNFWATSGSNAYAQPPGTTMMNPASIAIAGGSQPHDNMHPYLAVTYIIALYGIYPSQD